MVVGISAAVAAVVALRYAKYFSLIELFTLILGAMMLMMMILQPPALAALCQRVCTDVNQQIVSLPIDSPFESISN